MRAPALRRLRWPGRALAALTRHRPTLRPRGERLYAGHRGEHVEVQVVSRKGIAPLRPRRRHSPGSRHRHSGVPPFDWGDANTGAEALADALLADATGSRHPAAEIRELAAGPLARLPREGFVLDQEELRRWSARAQHRRDERKRSAPDGATGRGRGRPLRS